MVPTPWFQHDDPNDPDPADLPCLVCPICGCTRINIAGHDYETQHTEPDLLPLQEISIHLAGACGHVWTVFFGDFGDETLLDVVAAPTPNRPRRYRRLSSDRRWKHDYKAEYPPPPTAGKA